MNSQTLTLNLSRRRCLKSVAALSAMAPGLAWHRPVRAAAHQAGVTSMLLGLVTHPDARWVGDVVLPQIGHPTPAALVVALTSRLSLFGGQQPTGIGEAEAWQQAFQKSVSADFAEGRCLLVSGWVLTRTEAELCALAALAADGA